MRKKVENYLKQNIENILNYGYMDENPRPRYKDGTPAHTMSVNHVVRQYDLSKEFPITEVRRIAWKSAIKEIFWIYQDKSNDLSVLNEKYNVHYWNEWESKDIPGTIGQRYGADVNKYDLIDNLILDIKENPYGRRKVLSLWQESSLKATDGLAPCAFLTIWNVRGEYLDMMLVQRSGDMLTASGAGGVNEVQYAALQMMIADCTGYKPGIFTHVVANEQIYDRHFDNAEEICKRIDNMDKEDREEPRMVLNHKDSFYDYTIDDFSLENYQPKEPQLTFELGI